MLVLLVIVCVIACVLLWFKVKSLLLFGSVIVIGVIASDIAVAVGIVIVSVIAGVSVIAVGCC